VIALDDIAPMLHDASMATILIRNLDDMVAERLRVQARLRGVSVEEEARRLLTAGTSLTREEFAAEAAAIRARQRPNRTRAVRLIREDRNR
jgi:plasmid stability protein